ncbi:MAG: hypothetical protein H7A40_03175 [Chlamydiales bacterium]|nr:hypothetical protein [Chlamydiales bacterium]
MKRLILIPILTILFLAYNTHFKRTKGFCVEKVKAYSRPADSKYDMPQSDFDAQSALNQTFYYLSSGASMYVFVSEDQRYVLKLFKQRHMRPFSVYEKLIGYPLIPSKQRSLNNRLQFRKKAFDSCLIAYSKFRDQTGVLYMHLNPTSHLNVRLRLVDHKGSHLLLNADKEEYYIQRKGEGIIDCICKWHSEGERETIRNALKSLVELIIARCEREIGDFDNCSKNFAFIDGKAIEIDIGEFWNDPGVKERVHINAHIITATFDLRNYLAKHYPELRDDLDEILREYGAV